MDEKSRGGLFRTRNVLGAVAVAGIVAGVYLGDLWKGFGGGSTIGVGVNDPSSGSSAKSGDTGTAKTEPNKSPKESTDDPKPAAVPFVDVPPVIKVVIDDRSYSIRSADGDKPAEISQIVELAKAAAGDADGIRVRIYRKLSSRTSAEIALQDALTAAGIRETQIFWPPTPID